MDKFILALGLAAFSATGAYAYWLPNPEIVSETVENGKVTIEWTYDQNIERCNAFQVIVYKKHRAAEDEKFTLAKTNFEYLSSTGTLEKAEERGAIWDYVEDCPGWWVKWPMYMDKAMGIHTFNYFAGADNSDIFGGAYMVSPDYDLSDLSDKTLLVKGALANEAVSVSGGFAVWAWNLNWWDVNNIDYKPITSLDFHYDDLSSYNWKDVEETCVLPKEEDFDDPDEQEEVRSIQTNRTRVMFYGVGYSTYWVNGFEVAVNMKKGETVDYGASFHRVEGNTFTIDTTGDTEDDFIYAYEVRAMLEEYDEYRDLTTIRATNYAYNEPRHVIGVFASIGNTIAADKNFNVKGENGKITVEGAEGEAVSVYNIAGMNVFNGVYTEPIAVEGGIYLVKVGTDTFKVAL